MIGYHGTRRVTIERLLDGEPFDRSENTDDWLGHGVYFWEHAHQQAWWWAERRFGDEAAVVGAVIRLGQCIDLLDPENVGLLQVAHRKLVSDLAAKGELIPNNANNHKYLDCAVFNQLYRDLASEGLAVESTRAVFVTMVEGAMPRLWTRSGVLKNAHIQLCVREPTNIIGVWSVRKDGSYGRESKSEYRASLDASGA